MLRLSCCNALPFAPVPPGSLWLLHCVCGDPHSWQTNTKTTAISSLIIFGKNWGIGLCDSHQCRKVSLKEAVTHNEIQRICRKSVFGPPQEWINTGVSDNFLSLAELLCILQRWGTAGNCNNFSSLFTPNPTAVIHSDGCGFLGPPWLCWCSSFMLQLPRLSLERERGTQSLSTVDLHKTNSKYLPSFQKRHHSTNLSHG